MSKFSAKKATNFHINSDLYNREKVLRIIEERTGIKIQNHQFDALDKSLELACGQFGYSDINSYISHIQQLDSQSEEFSFLVHGVTIDESYFFREPEQLNFLKNVWFPGLIAKRRHEGNRQIRVWSAGCSRGQELYTIAIMLEGLIADVDDWNIHLLGTDINASSLGKAMKGSYNDWAMRNTPEDIKRRCFRKHLENGEFHYILLPEFRRHVHFEYLNLASASFPSVLTDTMGLDLILCRNVFIYLDPEIRGKILKKFSKCLVDQGMLILGSSDPMDQVPEILTVQPDQYSCYYRCSAPSNIVEAPSPPPSKAKLEDPGLYNSHPLSIEPPTENDGDSEPNKLEQLYLEAQLQANQGRLNDAEKSCLKLIELCPTEARYYLLQGLILAEQNRVEEADRALHRTLFLEHDNIEALYRRGILALRRQQNRQGTAWMHNALILSKRMPPDDCLPYWPDVKYGELVETLEQELKIYKQVY